MFKTFSIALLAFSLSIQFGKEKNDRKETEEEKSFFSFLTNQTTTTTLPIFKARYK